MRNRYLPLLICLGLAFFSQMALAETPGHGCQMSVQALARAVEPVTRLIPEQPANLPDGLIPDPTNKAVVGDCCPGNKVALCDPPPAGWHVRCDSPHCETGEFSCLYWR